MKKEEKRTNSQIALEDFEPKILRLQVRHGTHVALALSPNSDTPWSQFRLRILCLLAASPQDKCRTNPIPPQQEPDRDS